MWHVQTEPTITANAKNHVLNIEVCVDESEFLVYLRERKIIYPTFLGINLNFWLVASPYQSYVSPFPEEQTIRVLVNEPFKITFPRLFLYKNVDKVKENIIATLLEWLNEEFEFYQEEKLQIS